MWEPFEARLREKLAAMPNGDRALARLAWLLNVRRIRWWVWLLAYGPPLAFALHAQLTYSPLQRWLAERQLEQFGAYYPTLTASFIAGALSALWGLPILIVALARLARQTDAASRAASGAPAGTARVDAAEARADRAAALI